ncbi:MAG: AI-2E family transporter [Rhizobiales bacterium]|nr:AI-2E family transporter [Hyphomicrobiales bacterium]OJY04876.1 MAG: AI-2E family transporter [Rhizobiales bacterium 63-22]
MSDTNTKVKKSPDETDADEIFIPSDPVVVLLSVLVVLAILCTAYVAAEIVLPIVLAFVLKLLFQPGMRFLERFKIPKGLAALILILLVFGAIVAIGAAVSGPAAEWASKLPAGVQKLQERLKFLNEPIDTLKTFFHQLDGYVGQGSEPSRGGSGIVTGIATGILSGGTHFASSFFETILILFFLLVSGSTFLKRIVEILPRFKDKRQVVEISLDVERNISAYLVTITLMNAAVGIATGLAMWVTGVGDPVLWGVVAFFLNYVPIMGPLLGVFVFLLAGLLVIDSLWLALLPAALYFLIHIVEGEIVTPMLLARRFTLNPVLVIMALIFWFWMWGVPGAILAVPMLAIVKIVCDGIRPLAAIGHFLSGDE